MSRFHPSVRFVEMALAVGLVAFPVSLWTAGCGATASGGYVAPGDDPGADSGSGGGRTDDAGAPQGSSPDLAMNHGGGGPGDMAMTTQPPADMAMQPLPMGSVGPKGGTVNLLHFGVSGDTRPPACEDIANYPVAIINGIADAIKARGVQFTMDLGDHMYVCNSSLNAAIAQMNLFMSAVKRFGGTWFMTMGNHECWHGPCLLGSQEANYLAFMSALSPISNKPYYTFNVNTSLGLATFVVIADNAWDNVQANWLDQTLATADKSARYTIVARHHPEGDTSVITNADSVAIIRAHKFSLFLTGHSHEYHHMTTDNGRDVVIGNGGAPLIQQGTFYGYGIVDQLQNGQLQLNMYDLNGGALQDSFRVNPN